jgi:ribose-phosphate pyrophosphokinase
MNSARFAEVVVTDTLPMAGKDIKGLKLVSVAPLFAEAIKRNYENLSISSLFD